MDKGKQVHCFGLKNGGVVVGSEEEEQEARLFHAQKGKLMAVCTPPAPEPSAKRPGS